MSAIPAEKKTSLRISSEVVRLPVKKHEARQTHSAFPLPSAIFTETLTFRSMTALQHCLNHLPPCGGQSADFSPPYRFNCLLSFFLSFQFHDLRLV